MKTCVRKGLRAAFPDLHILHTGNRGRQLGRRDLEMGELILYLRF